MKSCLIFVFLLLLNVVNSTNVKPCKNGEPFPLSVELDGCDEPPCDVTKGKISVLNVHFVGTKDNITKLTTKARAFALGINVSYQLPDEVADVCSNLLYGAMCPIDKTEDVVYKCDFYVDHYYPEIGVRVEVSLMDEFNESIACFNIDIKVRKGPTEGN